MFDLRALRCPFAVELPGTASPERKCVALNQHAELLVKY